MTVCSLIAIMLGVLHLSIEKCINLYVNMMDDVFQQVSWSYLSWGLKIKPMYSSKALKRGILKAIEAAGHPDPEEVRFRFDENPICQVYVDSSTYGPVESF